MKKRVCFFFQKARKNQKNQKRKRTRQTEKKEMRWRLFGMVFFVVDKKIKEIGDVEQTSFWRLLELITRFKTYYEKRKRGKRSREGCVGQEWKVTTETAQQFGCDSRRDPGRSLCEFFLKFIVVFWLPLFFEGRLICSVIQTKNNHHKQSKTTTLNNNGAKWIG